MQNKPTQKFLSDIKFPDCNFFIITFHCSLYNQQQEVWNQWQNGGGDINSVPYYAPNYAAATATYGNNGIHQTASIYPPNPVILESIGR